jgi:hypothetical protein
LVEFLLSNPLLFMLSLSLFHLHSSHSHFHASDIGRFSPIDFARFRLLFISSFRMYSFLWHVLNE